MTFGSLFAGIGGFDLGFERAGLSCGWQVEINTHSAAVLQKHWPHVRRWDDVLTFPPEPADDWRVDCICGGFPCQDISNAGPKVGIDGERSGLWNEFSRIVRVLRPAYVVVENVAALNIRGLDRVLGDLAGMGFDAEWGVLSACALGAPHMRERMFVVAHTASSGRTGSQDSISRVGSPHDGETGSIETEQIGGCVGIGRGEWWLREPAVARVDHGLSARLVDSPNRAVGNSVSPQVTEWIARRFLV